MQVVKSNFQTLLPQIETAIKQADFISIDTELTGLHSSRRNQDKIFDTLQQRYEKVRNSCNSFQILQYGICAFRFDEESDSYIATPISAYLFPRSNGSSNCFLVQPASVEFLAGHKFDFNKSFLEGVGFLSMEDETRLRQGNSIDAAERDPVVLSDNDREYLEKQVFEPIDEWLQNRTGNAPLSLTPSSGFQRLITYQEVAKRYNGKLSLVKVVDGREVHLEVSTCNNSGNESGNNESNTKNVESAAIRQMIGFRRVIDMIVASKKPLIGHNCWLDLGHTFGKFIERLPDSVSDFKEKFLEKFPVDYLVNLIPSNHLSELYEQVSKDRDFPYPQIRLDTEFSGYEEGELFHDAAYDAYCTGFSFLKLMGKIHVNESGGSSEIGNDFSSKSVAQALRSDSFLETEWVNSLKNQVNVMHSFMKILRLDGVEEVESRPFAYYLSKFPCTWKTDDIQNAFIDHCGKPYVTWLNDTSAIVEFENDVSELMKRMQASESWKSIAIDEAGNEIDIKSFDSVVGSFISVFGKENVARSSTSHENGDSSMMIQSTDKFSLTKTVVKDTDNLPSPKRRKHS